MAGRHLCAGHRGRRPRRGEHRAQLHRPGAAEHRPDGRGAGAPAAGARHGDHGPATGAACCMRPTTSPWSHLRHGDHVQAVARCRQAFEVAQEMGFRQTAGVSIGNMGEVYRDAGRPRPGDQVLRYALRIAVELRDWTSVADQVANVAATAAAQGDRTRGGAALRPGDRARPAPRRPVLRSAAGCTSWRSSARTGPVRGGRAGSTRRRSRSRTGAASGTSRCRRFLLSVRSCRSTLGRLERRRGDRSLRALEEHLGRTARAGPGARRPVAARPDRGRGAGGRRRPVPGRCTSRRRASSTGTPTRG